MKTSKFNGPSTIPQRHRRPSEGEFMRQRGEIAGMINSAKFPTSDSFNREIDRIQAVRYPRAIPNIEDRNRVLDLMRREKLRTQAMTSRTPSGVPRRPTGTQAMSAFDAGRARVQSLNIGKRAREGSRSLKERFLSTEKQRLVAGTAGGTVLGVIIGTLLGRKSST